MQDVTELISKVTQGLGVLPIDLVDAKNPLVR
jgi:hypothetical protein